MLFQNCILLKDSRNSPLICRKKDVVSKTICAGVCLQGATSKRDRMWQSPVFTCIRANRIPVKRIKRTAVRNDEMQVDLPSHCSYHPLHLIQFLWTLYRYNNTWKHRETNLSCLRNFIIKRKMTACKKPDKYSRICFPKFVEYKKHPWTFLDKGIIWMLWTTIFGSMILRMLLGGSKSFTFHFLNKI